MMPRMAVPDAQPIRSLSFEVASALSQGRRETQEDAVVADFPAGAGVGLVVLSDGMGGHNAGDVASNIVVTEVFRELKRRTAAMASAQAGVTEMLRRAADVANESIGAHTQSHPETAGMGATLIGLVQRGDTLSWISIGDSVLFLFRSGKLYQLNQDHSLAPQIDYLVKQGVLSEDAARNHPDRNCLTSALLGEEIPFVDCPDTPLQLRPGDVVLAASDGLTFLERDEIQAVLTAQSGADASELADCLMKSVEGLNDPDQDNICLTVIRAAPDAAGRGGVAARLAGGAGLFGRLRTFGNGWLK